MEAVSREMGSRCLGESEELLWLKVGTSLSTYEGGGDGGRSQYPVLQTEKRRLSG